MVFLCCVFVVLLLVGVVSGFIGICLRGGKYCYEGRVEVEYNGEWRVVCDYGWDKKVVKVVC